MQYTRNNFPLWLFSSSSSAVRSCIVCCCCYCRRFLSVVFLLFICFYFSFLGPHFPSLYRMRMWKRESIQFSLIIIAHGKRFGKWNLCVFLFRTLFDQESTHTMLKLTILSVVFCRRGRTISTQLHTQINDDKKRNVYELNFPTLMKYWF